MFVRVFEPWKYILFVVEVFLLTVFPTRFS